MEGCLHHSLWPLRTPSHVLWAVQLPAYLSGVHGFHLRRHDCRRVADHLHGRCPSICRNPGRMPRMDQASIGQDERGRPPSQTCQMRFRPNGGRILRIGGQEQGSAHGPYQTQGSRTMGTTQISQSGQILHWILQLLSKIHPTFLHNRLTTHKPDQKKGTFHLGNGTG